MPKRSSILSLTLAVIIGVVIGFLLQAPDTTPKASSTAPSQTASLSTSQTPASQIDQLTQALQQESTARQALQQQVEQLSLKLARVEKNTRPDKSTTTEATSQDVSTPAGATGSTWFNQQALIDAGMDDAQAKSLKERFEKQELERLYLRDQAVREGWFGSRRYRDELQKLEAQSDNIKTELDEDAYAAYLYASGLPNQVKVQSVLASSSADTAGILAGDQIIRYENKRIYNWRDLRDATTEGNINETVRVDILRDNKPMVLYVQRGPLGIRMSSESAAP